MTDNSSIRIALGSDHAGYELKETIREFLETQNYTVKDFGTYTDESCDYPDFVIPAAESVAKGDYQFGIVFGGSGNGEAIAANKVKGIRCAVCWTEESGRLAREHNDANIISMGARLVEPELAKKIILAWQGATFEGERHLRRINKLAEYEK